MCPFNFSLSLSPRERSLWMSLTLRWLDRFLIYLPVLVKEIRPDCIIGMNFVNSAASREFCIRQCSKTIAFDDVGVPFLPHNPSTTAPACCMAQTTLVARMNSSVVIPARCTQILMVKVERTRSGSLRAETGIRWRDRRVTVSSLRCVKRVRRAACPRLLSRLRACVSILKPVNRHLRRGICNRRRSWAASVRAEGARFQHRAWTFSGRQGAPRATSVKRFTDTVSAHEFDLGTAAYVRHKIQLVEGAQPLRQRPRRVPLHLKKAVEQKLQHGVIEPSSSPWARNLIIAKKKLKGHTLKWHDKAELYTSCIELHIWWKKVNIILI